MMPLVAAFLIAQQGQRQPQVEPTAVDSNYSTIATSITNGSVRINGSEVKYKATAGHYPIRNLETGEVEAKMFAVTYEKEGERSGSRPVMYCFNGGPGSASLWLHMGGLGPKRAPLPDDDNLPRPPYSPMDNPEAWLDFTDLVFIDAPNTGYSRVMKSEFRSKFFGVQEDIRAFTEFIRVWIKQHNRFDSPMFVAGESYGGMRGSGLVKSLLDSGIAVHGFVSISGTNNFLTLDGMRGNDTTYISFLPTFAATAWYHKRLGNRFKTVEDVVAASQDFIAKEYAAALSRGDSLTDAEKGRVAQRLSELTGLSKQYCLDSNLRIPEFRFFRELMREKSQSVGRYDARFLGKEELRVGDNPSNDPSDTAITSPFVTAINSYLANDLKVKTEMRYNTFGSVGPWRYPQGSYADTSGDLAETLRHNKHFQVLFTMGYYDMACPFQGTIYTVDHMGLDTDARKRVHYTYYPAGHMMYIESGSRLKLRNDVKKFVEDCLK